MRKSDTWLLIYGSEKVKLVVASKTAFLWFQAMLKSVSFQLDFDLVGEKQKCCISTIFGQNFFVHYFNEEKNAIILKVEKISKIS